jgi:hypothetical protein
MLRGRNSGSQAASLPSDVRTFLESLRPGQSVDLVLNPIGSRPLDVRRTLILEIDPQRGVIERLAVRLYASQSELARFRTRCCVAHTAEESDMQRDYVRLSFLDPTRQQQDLLHAVILKMQLFISARGLT